MDKIKLYTLLLLCFSLCGGNLLAQEPDPALVAHHKMLLENYAHDGSYYFDVGDRAPHDLDHEKELIAFAKALEENKNVKKLLILDYAFSPKSAAAIQKALEKNRTLQTLLVSDGSISGAEFLFPAIAEALKTNLTLKEVSGSGSKGLTSNRALENVVAVIQKEAEKNEKIQATLETFPGIALKLSKELNSPDLLTSRVPKELMLIILDKLKERHIQELKK